MNNVHNKMIKNNVFKYIHVFTDSKDEHINVHLDTWNEAIKKAIKIKNKWIKQGFYNIRIYSVHEEQDHRDGEIFQISEDCIFSLGNYPS